jgi:type IV pilus assembly protein PilV
MIARRARSSGFTIVELMMSLAVLAVGVSGIIAMQKVTATTNLHAKSIATATRVAQAWQAQLMVDGSLWRIPHAESGVQTTAAVSLSKTLWLKNQNSNPAWFRPVYDPNLAFGAAFDALGNPVTDANLGQAHFCVHLQIVPLTRLENAAEAPNAALRVTTRVVWPRAQGAPVANHCAPDIDPNVVGNDTTNFHSIYQTIAIRIHP